MPSPDVAAAVARWQGRKRVDVEATRRGRKPRPAWERVLGLTVFAGTHWLWTGARDGLIRTPTGRRSVRAVAWEAVGLPPAARLTRACGQERCFNPRHMAQCLYKVDI